MWIFLVTSLGGQRRLKIDSLHLFKVGLWWGKGRGSESARGSINSLHSILTIIHHKVFIKSTQSRLVLFLMRHHGIADWCGKRRGARWRRGGKVWNLLYTEPDRGCGDNHSITWMPWNLAQTVCAPSAARRRTYYSSSYTGFSSGCKAEGLDRIKEETGFKKNPKTNLPAVPLPLWLIPGEFPNLSFR